MLESLMHKWERRLSLKDKNRTTLPFDWGFEFLNHTSVSSGPKQDLLNYNANAIQNSVDFFRSSPQTFQADDITLKFQSSIDSPYPQNNAVRCTIFEPKTATTKAVV